MINHLISHLLECAVEPRLVRKTFEISEERALSSFSEEVSFITVRTLIGHE